jgi:hypothetical protein
MLLSVASIWSQPCPLDYHEAEISIHFTQSAAWHALLLPRIINWVVQQVIVSNVGEIESLIPMVP